MILAFFRICFTRDQRSIPADRLHAQVDACLEELRSRGERTPPQSGRVLCVEWMKGTWLFRTIGDHGQEEYSLTSHAIEALDLVQSLSTERALISESRITTILDAARRFATEANPDRQARINRLDVQIRQLQAERERLENGGELATASDDRMLDGYANLVDLIRQLPGDFKRVEESVVAMHRQIVSDFRSEDRPISEVIDDYLRRTDELTKLTPEGRAFEGAFMLLRDEALLLDLRHDLDAILEHPFADALTAAEQRDFRGAVGVIRRGIDEVLVRRTRVTNTLRDHIVNHDVVRDRELDTTLRLINRQLEIWMKSAGPRSTVPIPLIPPGLDVKHLRERFWNPASDQPPPPLEDVSTSAPFAPTLDHFLSQGGPSYERLTAQLAAARDIGDDMLLSDLFNSLPDDLRRPVEILGLLHLTTLPNQPDDQLGVGAQFENRIDAIPADEFDAIRPDGTRCSFLVSRRAIEGSKAVPQEPGHD